MRHQMVRWWTAFTCPALLALSASILVACGFPDVTYAVDGAPASDGVAGDSGPSADSSADQGTPEGSGSEAGAETSASGDSQADQDATVTVDSSIDGPREGSSGADSSVTDAGPDGPNCNCASGSLYPTGVSCGILGTGVLCGSSQGFSSVSQPCGTSGDYVVCMQNGLSCGATHSTKVQECH